jgi:uncharacterized membrane protein YedE/YeeE
MMHFVSLFCGALFAIGLGLSGMTNPQKVIGFLDITGNWQPALMFVMIGAITIHSLTYYLVKGKKQTLLGKRFSLPSKKDADMHLILGSAIFGMGWGVGGYCPGPALASLGAFLNTALVFTLAMVVGSLVAIKLKA